MGSHPAQGARPLRSLTATRNALVLLLAFTGGCVDAISYLGFGHIFTANMTGNTVLLGVSVTQAQWPAALRSALALAAYLVGVAGGSLLVDRVAKDPPEQHGLWPHAVTIACALELLILCALTLAGALFPSPLSGTTHILIMLAAAAMGLQSIAVHTLGIRGVATTYITGTWTTLVAGLVRRHPRADEAGKDPPGTAMHAAVVGVYLLAAVVGGAAIMRWHLFALAIPTVAVAVVVVSAWSRFGRSLAETVGAPMPNDS